MGLIVLLAVVAIGGFVFFRYASPAAVRDLTAQRLADLTGREVEIAGDFDYAFSLTPTVEAQRLTIANAEWGRHPHMLAAERVAVELEILPLLLDGELRVGRFLFERAEAFVERGPQGQLNWQLDPVKDAPQAATDEAAALAVDALTVLDSTIVWRQDDGSNMAAAIERLAWQADPADGALSVEASGRFAEQPFAVQGTLGTLAALTQAEAPSPIDLEISLGTARLLADGQVDFPLTEPGTELALVMSGESAAVLEDVLGRELPPLADWQLSAAVSSGEGGLQATEIAGQVAGPEGLQFTVADGSVDDVLAGSGLSLPAAVAAPSLAGVEALAGAELPPLGAFRAEGRLVGSFDSLGVQNAAGWIGPEESQPLLEVTGGSIGDVIAGRGFDLQLRAPGGGAEALSDLLGRSVTYDSLTAEARLTGDLGQLTLQDLDAEAAQDGARLAVSGTVGGLSELMGLDLSVTAEGPTLASFGPLLGMTLPQTPPLEIAGQVTGGGDAVALENLSATVADTQVQGRLSVALPEAAVPRLEGELSVAELDLDAILADRADGVEAGTAARTERAPLDLPALENFEGELALQADAVVVEGRRFTDASTTLRLQDGRLAVNDFTARVAGGDVTADAALATAEGPEAEVVLRLQAEEIEAGQLIGTTPGRVRGQVDIDLNVDATGRSLDELAENLEGDVALFGEEGELEDVPLNRMIPDLDITRILPFFRGRDSTVRVNCVIGEFDIENGVARTDSMLDTQRMTLLGSGAVDLGEGILDLSLRPVAKSRKLSGSTVPVDIEGSFSDPEINPRVGEAAGGALRGLLGGLLVPLNQISALFGDDARDACSDALREARARAGAAGAEQ